MNFTGTFFNQYCSSLLFITTVHHDCASLLCITTVHHYCASLLCITAVHHYCASILFITIVHHYRASLPFILCIFNNKVNPRLQRHFTTLAVGFPGPTSLLTIYQTFLDGHLKRFSPEVQALSSNLINAALVLHAGCVKAFRKTAKNFHYEFNLRHLSNVFQGLLNGSPSRFDDPAKFVQLWLHESERVYGDQLVSKSDLGRYYQEAQAQSKRRFPAYNMAKYFASENADILLFCHFADGVEAVGSVGGEEAPYDQVLAIENIG